MNTVCRYNINTTTKILKYTSIQVNCHAASNAGNMSELTLHKELLGGNHSIDSYV